MTYKIRVLAMASAAAAAALMASQLVPTVQPARKGRLGPVLNNADGIGTSDGDGSDNSLEMPYSNERHRELRTVMGEECWSNRECHLDLHGKQVLLMHLGKAGGGSVLAIANQHKVMMPQCHPSPNSCHVSGSKRILITLRDPVDRFVSAFNWRAALLCGDPDVDHRQHDYRRAIRYPTKYCQNPRSSGRARGEKAEADTLHYTNHYNVNEFAESLCLEGPKGVQARKDVSLVLHMKDPIKNWVKSFLNSKSKYPELQEIVAMVMEDRDYPFEETVNDALRHVIGQEYSSAYVTAWDGNVTKATSGNKPVLKSGDKHSSQSAKVFPGVGIEMAKISPLGSCCVARHLQKDYQILRAMAGMEVGSGLDRMDDRLRNACHWGTEEDTQRCIHSIKSIVQRRESYLVNMATTSCEDAIAG